MQNKQQLFLCKNMAAARSPGGKRKSTEKKGEVEKKRVKDVRGEYDCLASLLGLCQKRLNKAAILEAAVKFIQQHHEGLDIPLIPNSSQSVMIKKQHTKQLEPGPVVDHSSQEVTAPSTSMSASSSENLLCLEEFSYQDESDEEETMHPEFVPPPFPPPGPLLQSAKPRNADSSSPPAQLCGCIPSMSVVFSPKSPWLTSSSPQITSVFTTNFSPPIQPMRCQTTPRFPHFSSPITTPVVPSLYDGPCITIPNSPGLLSMNSYDEEYEICWVSGDECSSEH